MVEIRWRVTDHRWLNSRLSAFNPILARASTTDTAFTALIHKLGAYLCTRVLRSKYRKHCTGPRCNVIAEVQRLAEPIRHVKGAL
eukprot:6398767-Prymnesium_polylepis.1